MNQETASAQGTVTVPADVPEEQAGIFTEHFNQATNGTGRLMLFAGDQKVEHLNADFSGPGISPDDATPLHLFQIAAKARIGVFATQLGLITRYGKAHPGIPYLVKLNAKTNLVPFQQKDPLSCAWNTVEEVVAFKQATNLQIMGVGYTVYPGSDYEAEMLREAAGIVHQAHLHGLIAVLWVYPKGKAVSDEHDPALIAGAAGLAACLGADFVKLKVPYRNKQFDPQLLAEVVAAAGSTGVLCEGGKKEDAPNFLAQLYAQIQEGGCRGSGTGRNIHQRGLKEAIAMANAIHAVTVENKAVADALTLLEH